VFCGAQLLELFSITLSAVSTQMAISVTLNSTVICLNLFQIIQCQLFITDQQTRNGVKIIA